MIPTRKRLHRKSVIIISDSENDDFVDLTSSSPKSCNLAVDISPESVQNPKERKFYIKKGDFGRDSNFGYAIGNSTEVWSLKSIL